MGGGIYLPLVTHLIALYAQAADFGSSTVRVRKLFDFAKQIYRTLQIR